MSANVHAPAYQILLSQLRAARESSGLSQRELSQRLGMSSTYIAKQESGYSRMDIVQIRAYLEAVNKPFLEFMTEYEAAIQRNKI